MNKKEMIRNFLSSNLNTAGLSDDDNLFHKGYVNSLFALQLVVFLEDEFKIKISNNEIKEENFNSINNIAETVARIEEQ